VPTIPSTFGTVTFSGSEVTPHATHTASHTLEAGVRSGNTVLVVGVATIAFEEAVGATWGGVPMNKAVENVRGLNPHVSFWYLVNPATGTQDIVATFASGVNASTIMAANFENCANPPVGAAEAEEFQSTSTARAFDTMATTLGNSLIVIGVGVAHSGGDPFTPEGSETELWDGDSGSPSSGARSSSCGGFLSAPTVTTYNYAWTGSIASRYCIAAFELLGFDPDAKMRVATGTYVANDTGQSITGVGFAPAFVLTRAEDAVSLTCLRTNAMPALVSAIWDASSALQTTAAIISLDADGFTVGSGPNANASGVGLYHWVAFSSAPTIFARGSYTGDGVDSTTINGVGFQPNIVLGARTNLGGTVWAWWLQSLGGDNVQALVLTTGSPFQNRFQGVSADGFEVGTLFNISGDDHFWLAWKITATQIAQAGYTGNGASRSFAIGFQPKIVFTYKQSPPPSLGLLAYRQDTLSGDNTFRIPFSGGQSNLITSLDANGFTLGTSDVVNELGSAYHYLAFGDVVPVPPPPLPPLPPPLPSLRPPGARAGAA